MGTATIAAIDGHWVGGSWTKGRSEGTVAVENPATEEVIGSIPAGTGQDMQAAIAAARRALPAWSATPVSERQAILGRIAEALNARADVIAHKIAIDVGTPLKLSRAIQAELPIGSFRTAERIVGEFPFERRIGNSQVLMEPVGVVVCITPWNYPLHQIAAKIAPCLAVGCTVVLKPSEVAPLVVAWFIEALEAAGLPPGVVNVVWGRGPDLGQVILDSADVDMISFTGSTRTGRYLAGRAGEALKRISLELGGKSASLIMPSADVVKAVKATVANSFLNSGQTCSALTRLLVPRVRLDDITEMAVDLAQGFVVGDPLDPTTRLGPLVSADQRSRVIGMIEEGIQCGAHLACGGTARVEGLSKGHFVAPTIFTDVDPHAVIAQEEIFGPVLSIIPYDSEADAIEIANGTKYGLAGAVWAGDEREAERIARSLRTGQVDLNGGRFNPLAPFGGVKTSGIGREMGVFGFEEFVEAKSLQH